MAASKFCRSSLLFTDDLCAAEEDEVAISFRNTIRTGFSTQSLTDLACSTQRCHSSLAAPRSPGPSGRLAKRRFCCADLDR